MRTFISLVLLLTGLQLIGQTPKDSSEVPKGKFADISGVDRYIFYHISYDGGPLYKGGPAKTPIDRNDHTLFWHTHKILPNTYFIIEDFCWNKWVKRGKVTSEKCLPGHGNYAGKIEGKYLYRFKVVPHSGENKWRLKLMNDSNMCLAVSKELRCLDKNGEILVWTPKVEYDIKKKTQEICFSDETNYELYDGSGKLVDEGRGKTISYADLEKGTYTLNYDNSTATIKLK